MHGLHQPQDTNAQSGILEEPIEPPISRRLVLLAVEHVLADRIGVDIGQVCMPTRGPAHVVFARHLAVYLAHTVGGLSLTDCGLAFERTRGAAMNAVNRLDERRETYPAFDRVVPLLQADVARRYAQHLLRWRAGV